jgi:hypothetical protein
MRLVDSGAVGGITVKRVLWRLFSHQGSGRHQALHKSVPGGVHFHSDGRKRQTGSLGVQYFVLLTCSLLIYRHTTTYLLLQSVLTETAQRRAKSIVSWSSENFKRPVNRKRFMKKRLSSLIENWSSRYAFRRLAPSPGRMCTFACLFVKCMAAK